MARQVEQREVGANRLRIGALVALFGLFFTLLGPTPPAFAAHFISVEADAEVFMDGTTPKLRLTLTHKWTSSGAFSPVLKSPAGSTISGLPVSGGLATQVQDSNGNNISGLFRQIYEYNLSSLTTATNGKGVYTLTGSSCCRVESFNTSGSGSFSFEVGFYYDPDVPAAWRGSPAFTSSLLTTISKGNDFSQNLGGSSRNGLTSRFSFVTNAAQNGVSVPSGITIGSSTGVLTIPGSTTTTIGATHSKFGLKLLLEELDANGVVVGYVTRDIGYDLTTGSPPTIAVADADGNPLSSGGSVSLAAGTTTTLTIVSTAAVQPVFSTSNLPNSGDTSWVGAGSAQTGTTTRTWSLILAPPGTTAAQTRPVEFIATASGLATPFTLNVTITPARPAIQTVGDGSLTVSWVAATGDNVLGYQVRYRANEATDWVLATPVDASATSQTISGLTNGVTYLFQVATRTEDDNGNENPLSSGDYSPSSAGAIPGTPTNNAVPTISPTSLLGVGTVVTATDPSSSWTNPLGSTDSLVVGYQWQRDGVDIAGATSSTYTLGVADIGARIKVVVVRSNAAGGTAASSAQTDAVLARATLSSLVLSTGVLSPAFASDVALYSVTVPNAVTSITLTPTSSGGSSITVSGASVTSGSESEEVALSVGTTVVSIVVTSGTSGRFTIRVSVTRLGASAQGGGGGAAGPVVPPAVVNPPRVLPRVLPTPPPVVGPVVQNSGGISTPPSQPTALVGGQTVVISTQVTDPNTMSLRAGVLNIGMNVPTGQGGGVSQQGGSTELQVRNGGSAGLTGSGLLPRSTVQVFMPLGGSNSREIARIPVDANGAFSGDAIFGATPSEAPLPIGRHVLQMVTVDENRQQTVVELTVNIAQPPPAPELNRATNERPTLLPGQSIATNGGSPEPVTVTPIPDQKQATIQGDGWSMAVGVEGDGGVASGEGGAVVTFVRDQGAVVSGEGFMPNTRADVWLFSDPTLLGTVEIDENGEFNGVVNIDGNVVTVGEHTLQLQGVGEDGFVRAANLGVSVMDEAPALTEESSGSLFWLWALVLLGVVSVAAAGTWLARRARV